MFGGIPPISFTLINSLTFVNCTLMQTVFGLLIFSINIGSCQVFYVAVGLYDANSLNGFSPL